jgi:hypothetical protein
MAAQAAQPMIIVADGGPLHYLTGMGTSSELYC